MILAEKIGLIGLAGWVVLFVVVIVALRNHDRISRWWFDCVRGGYPLARPLPNGPLNDYDVHLIETTALAAMAERAAALGTREAGMLGSYAEMLRSKVVFLKHERFLIDYVLSAFDARLPVVVIGPNMGAIAAACALLGRQAIAVERDPVVAATIGAFFARLQASNREVTGRLSVIVGDLDTLADRVPLQAVLVFSQVIRANVPAADAGSASPAGDAGSASSDIQVRMIDIVGRYAHAVFDAEYFYCDLPPRDATLAKFHAVGLWPRRAAALSQRTGVEFYSLTTGGPARIAAARRLARLEEAVARRLLPVVLPRKPLYEGNIDQFDGETLGGWVGNKYTNRTDFIVELRVAGQPPASTTPGRRVTRRLYRFAVRPPRPLQARDFLRGGVTVVAIGSGVEFRLPMSASLQKELVQDRFGVDEEAVTPVAEPGAAR